MESLSERLTAATQELQELEKWSSPVVFHPEC